MFHWTQTEAHHIASAVLYQVCYRARLLIWKSNAYGAGCDANTKRHKCFKSCSMVNMVCGDNSIVLGSGENESSLIDNLLIILCVERIKSGCCFTFSSLHLKWKLP